MTARSRSARLATGLGVYATAVLVVMWVGFAIALVSDPDLLDQAWRSLRELPVVPQVLAWVLLLPAAIGLWAWTADLPTLAGLAVVAGLVGWTLVAVRSFVRSLRAP